MDLIIYHNACFDGYAAAYIAKLRYPEAKLVPLDHGLSEAAIEDIMSRCIDKDVLMLDYSFRSREHNDRLSAVSKSFLLLDHHLSAQKVIGDAPYAVFDMERSGAGLTWDYLFGEDSSDACYDQGTNFEPRPWWVDYIENRDLWRFTLPESKAVNAFIMTTAYDLQSWREMTEVKLEDAIRIGKAVELEINKYIREVVKQVQPGQLNIGDHRTYTIGVVNVPYLHTSDIGNVLAHRWDVGLGWFERHDNMIQFSARSLGDIDVSVIAQHFGGGGHAHAAGWNLSIAEGRQLIDRILDRVPPGPPTVKMCLECMVPIHDMPGDGRYRNIDNTFHVCKTKLDNRGGIGHN